MHALGDWDSFWPKFSKLCVHATNDDGRPHSTLAVQCVEDIEADGILRLLSADGFMYDKDDVVIPCFMPKT